ncbi:MATE family efflux transporter [Palleronia caenipelagi]|uniref:MATE family efflux transporter n=2 Tax=Palleronia caenipelagi TaxID=2489174 RepID=A0A547Q7Y1_9RHOB|nr:MATE family efflux transporter [Palleronia caenipelagi]
MRHVSVMSFTTSIGLMAMFAVDFIDMIFISMLGKTALAAAVGYAATLLFFTSAINIGLSIAAGSLVARSVGGGQAEDARSYATGVAALVVGVGIVVPIGALMFLPQLLSLLGAEGDVALRAAEYLRIVLPSMMIVGLAMAGGAVLRAYGDARRSMLATVAGGTVNAALDPLFIFGLGLDLEGAAWATVCARVAMAVMTLAPAIRRYDAFAIPSARDILARLRSIFAIALPAVLTNVATPVGMAIVTRQMAKFGTDAVAGLAVISRLSPVAFAVVFALSGAIGPIIGQNFGAGLFDRVRAAIRAGILFVGAYVLVVSVVLFLLRAPIAGIFDAEGVSRSLIYLFCGPIALTWFFNGVIFVGNAGFNNLGSPFYSTVVNWGRHTLGTWPLAALGAVLLGAPGVLIGQAAGGVIFALLSVILLRRITANPVAAAAEAEEVDPFQKERRLLIITGRNR